MLCAKEPLLTRWKHTHTHKEKKERKIEREALFVLCMCSNRRDQSFARVMCYLSTLYLRHRLPLRTHLFCSVAAGVEPRARAQRTHEALLLHLCDAELFFILDFVFS